MPSKHERNAADVRLSTLEYLPSESSLQLTVSRVTVPAGTESAAGEAIHGPRVSLNSLEPGLRHYDTTSLTLARNGPVQNTTKPDRSGNSVRTGECINGALLRILQQVLPAGGAPYMFGRDTSLTKVHWDTTS